MRNQKKKNDLTARPKKATNKKRKKFNKKKSKMKKKCIYLKVKNAYLNSDQTEPDRTQHIDVHIIFNKILNAL